jgi:hypothetical protein
MPKLLPSSERDIGTIAGSRCFLLEKPYFLLPGGILRSATILLMGFGQRAVLFDSSVS